MFQIDRDSWFLFKWNFITFWTLSFEYKPRISSKLSCDVPANMIRSSRMRSDWTLWVYNTNHNTHLLYSQRFDYIDACITL